MARKKTVAAPPPRELQNTLKIDGVTCNINAKKADTASQVVNALKIEKIKLDDKTSKDKELITEFNGSNASTVTIVPAEGGRFSGRITTPHVELATIVADGDTVLNSDDVKGYIVNELKNHSVLYEYVDANDGKGLQLHPGGEGAATKGICIVTGASGDVTALASQNNQNYSTYCRELEENGSSSTMFLSAFIYVSTDGDNRGLIYFCTCDSAVPSLVQVSADKANTANKLATSRDLMVDLDKKTEASFDGSTNVDIGIKGTLAVENGGFGADFRYDAEAARCAEYHLNRTISDDTSTITDDSTMIFRNPNNGVYEGYLCRKSTVSFWTYIAGKIRTIFGFNTDNVLTPNNGGTGVTNLNNLTVGSATTLAVHTSAGNGAIPQATYPSSKVILSRAEPKSVDGQNGDIWIVY